MSEWDRCRDWLLPAMAETTEAEVLAEIEAGRALLWTGKRSAMVTQLVRTPEPHIGVWIGGGDLRELLEIAPGAAAWARAQGAVAARINGRPGWARTLRKMGFRPDGDQLRMVL